MVQDSAALLSRFQSPRVVALCVYGNLYLYVCISELLSISSSSMARKARLTRIKQTSLCLLDISRANGV